MVRREMAEVGGKTVKEERTKKEERTEKKNG